MKSITRDSEIEDFCDEHKTSHGKTLSYNAVKEIVKNGGIVEVGKKDYSCYFLFDNDQKHVVYTSNESVEDGAYSSKTCDGKEIFLRLYEIPKKLKDLVYGEFSYKERIENVFYNEADILYANRKVHSLSLRKTVEYGKSACTLIFFNDLNNKVCLEEVLEVIIHYANELGAEILIIPDYILDTHKLCYSTTIKERMIGESPFYF